MQLCTNISQQTCLNTTTGAQVATLGKSGVSVGYYDTEENAARAYDRAAIGLLGRDNCSITTNFPLGDYDEEIVPQLIGKTREEVKTTLKNERAKVSAVTTFPVFSGHRTSAHCLTNGQIVSQPFPTLTIQMTL